jgi:tRNA nucleotidyltransferase (CCA-adding enzyme)
MEIILPDEVYQVITKFQTAGKNIYLVGGVVRDILLKRPHKDWDLTTDATPEQILELFPDGFYENQFGTVGINTKYGVLEVTTMRKEGVYEDSRHPTEVSWTKNIEEDLARRDFTINAMALQINQKDKPQIIDPFNGQKDLEQKLIRSVGESDKRFQEDALRLMRAIRFSAQLGFKIEDKTLESIKKNSQLIKNISWERIRDELFKILKSDNYYEGVILLKETGLLEYILPEVTKCFGIVQEGPKHDRVYDIGEHLLLSLKFCPSKDPLVRFACLVHDIGKLDTFRKDEKGNVTFYGHETVGARLVKEVGKRLRLSSKQIDKLYSLVRWHMFTVSEHQTDSAIRRFIRNVGLENIEDMMAVRVGDRLGGGTQTETSWRMEEFKKRIEEVMQKPFSISDLKITGTDVMEILQIKPGPKVGEILNKLFQEVLEDAVKNNKEYLTDQVRKIS